MIILKISIFLLFKLWTKIILADQSFFSEFHCVSTGKYADPRDPYCNRYYLCTKMPDESYIKTLYACPKSEKFSSATASCRKDYLCKSDNFACQETGRFADSKDSDCINYHLCTQMPDGFFIKTKYSCPNGTYFDPLKQNCSKNFTCLYYKHIGETLLSTTIAPSIKINCSKEGRFVNFEDSSCTTYYLCALRSNGTFIQRKYSCPLGSLFDPSLRVCSTLYQCPTSTTVSSRTSVKPLSGTTMTIDVVCNAKKRYADYKDPTCTSYFLCSTLRDGSFIQTKYTCPRGLYFDPKLQICSVFFSCSCLVLNTTTTSSLVSVTPVTQTTTSTACFEDKNYDVNFTCSKKGRFFNPRDRSCTSYFLCSLLRNGSFVKTKYLCPVESFFDPELQLCSTLYQCPCSMTSSTPANLETTSSSTVTSSLVTLTNFTTTATPSEICLADENDSTFTCFKKGRFVNPKDRTCTTYFLCTLLQNGSFIQTEYPCPAESFFDPEIQLCSTFYHCPCLKTTSVVSSTTPEHQTTPKPSDLTSYESTTEVTTTTTPRICYADQKNIDSFTCLEKGRFLNPRDRTCTSYFLCSILRNGSFIKTEYFCPAKSLFDPELQLCSTLYQCPCSITTPVTSSTPAKLETTSSSTITNSLVTLSNVTTTATSSEICVADENDTIFTCFEKGRFINPKDRTCTTYFLCTLLRNGSFIQTKYPCPAESFFDPEIQLCSTFYHCPCLKTTSVVSSTSTLKPSDLTSYESTTEVTTTTTSRICFADKNYIDSFTCLEKGRFLNPRDRTCTSYFLCSLLRNGSFIKTKYLCPVESFFDPELQLCSTLYQCPCSITTPVTSSTPVKLETTSSSTVTSSLVTLTNFTTTAASSGICLADENYSTFTCFKKGRFVNPKDRTCTTYFLCTLLRNGSFIQTEYPCPAESFFDPEIQLCSTFYHCPCLKTTSVVSSTTPEHQTTPKSSDLTSYESITEVTTTTTPRICYADQKNIDSFTCLEKGRFLNPRDRTCTSYFLCSILRNGSFIKTEYFCPAKSFFDPELQLCSTLYQCPCSITTPVTSSTPAKLETTSSSTITNSLVTLSNVTTTATSSEICVADENDTIFTCFKKGRFINPKDRTCTTYFLCTLLRNGSFIQTKYPCPAESFFDPEIQLCSTFYHCPCLKTTSVVSSTSTLKPSDLTSYESTTEVTTTTTTSRICFADKNYIDSFTCLDKGRFFNPKDRTCTSYFLCSILRNGSFIKTEYLCPVGSFFDAELQLCSIFYPCPCSTTSLTTTETTTTPREESCIVSNTSSFICTEKGRFLNKMDLSCGSYFLCNLLRNGTFIQTRYFCPKGSYFDPSIHICNTDYQCPCK